MDLLACCGRGTWDAAVADKRVLELDGLYRCAELEKQILRVKLKELQAKLGNRWKKISGFMPGRTENQVKNRFNAPSFRRLNNIPLKQAPEKSTSITDA